MTFLNSIPGVHISGENDGTVKNSWQMYESLRNAHGRKTVAWANTYKMSKIKQDMREMLTHVIKPPPGSNTIGFKEIRFEREDFHFIRMLFPCAKFLLSIREDVSKQARSAFHRKFNATKKKASLKMKNELFVSLSRSHPNNMYLVKLEEFSIKKIDDILRFLGRTDCKTQRVPELNRNEGYTKRTKMK